MDHSAAAVHTSNERSIEHLPKPSIAEALDIPSNSPSTTTLTVLVVKDERGYGMKVSGDNPVFVQSVKQSGAAEKAGLHSGDKIIKVNGLNVTHSTHTEVVDLIKSSTQVELTVQQRPMFINSSNPNLTLPPLPTMNSGTISSVTPCSSVTPTRPLHHHNSAPARDRITGPQPVDVEQMRHVELERWQTFRLMLEKEQKYLDALKKELQRSSEVSNGDNYKLKTELIGAERRVKILQKQLTTFKDIPPCNIVAQASSLQPPPLPPRNPPPLPPRNPTVPLISDKQSNNSHISGVNNSQTDSPNFSLCHQRTKSNPDQLSEGKPVGGKKLSLSESFNDLHFVKHSKGGLAWDVVSPPRQHSPNRSPDVVNPCDNSFMEMNKFGVGDRSSVDSSDVKLTQTPIISMEDDENSDQESNHLEEHGPFKSFTKLVEHNAHLAVFLNYVMSNSDPSALLFYLVTNLFKEGNAKEMKKWAYEIHSSFLVPGAPLRLTNIEENLIREIDDILQKDSDREEILRKVFWKARTKAKEELNEQLGDFRHRRTAGLGTLFGPPDFQLDDSINDKVKELKIIEMVLSPNMEPFIEDMEKEIVDDRRFTMAAAIATVLSKVFGVRGGTQFSTLLERCPTFVSKEKSLKAKLIGKCRKFTTKGHHFIAHQYFTVTYCNHCQLIIWGIGPQGYQCTNCVLNIHRVCVKVLDENCPGPLIKKDKGNDRISKLMDKIRPEREARRKPGLNFVQMEKSKRLSEDAGDIVGALPENDRTSLSGSSFHTKADDSFKSDRDSSIVEDMSHCPKLKPSGISINRSESYKERIHQKRQIRERRKTSDPNLPSKYKNDVEQEMQYSFARSDSSSNSNLSTKSLDSRSTSLEGIGQGGEVTSCLDSDSDDEFDLPDWASNVPSEILDKLSSKEKKRQEVINELYHTERSHIRGLKVLERVFHRPMKERQILPQDQLQLLFANLEQMFELHSQFCNAMKAVRKENQVVQNIGHVLLNTFDGSAGEVFQKAAATFCARQQIALESLKERRKKDTKLNTFLTEAEGNPICKRLQLKDILPTGMIRLTKYPLLFESLVKCTSNEEELLNIKRSFERSKIILNHVNQAVRIAEDELRLSGIQKKLDATPFEKVDHPLSVEFKNLDVTKHKLIHEGGLWLRIGGTRQKMIELHVLLLEDLIILLDKGDDKYVLKYYGFQDRNTLSPIIKMSTALVRHNAVDKKAMFLVNTSQAGAQIYDLVTTSSNERKTWFRHISEATEAYKARDGKIKKQEQASHVIDYEDIIQGTKKKSVTNNCTESPNNNNNNSSNNSQQLTSLDSSNCDISKRGDESFANNETPSVANSTPVLSKTQKCPLIEPSEVLVSQSSVLKAEPVITHLEKLRRNNKIIEEALHERLQLVADILKVPLSNSNNTSDGQNKSNSDEPNAILLTAVSQGNEIITVLNESLNLTDVDTIAASLGTSNLTSNCSLYKAYATQLSRITKVKPIVASLNSQITELLISTTKHGKLEEGLRKELQTYRERLHAFQEKSLGSSISDNNDTESTVENASSVNNSEKNDSSSEV